MKLFEGFLNGVMRLIGLAVLFATNDYLKYIDIDKMSNTEDLSVLITIFFVIFLLGYRIELN